MRMLSPALLQASFQSLLIVECEYRLPSSRLEAQVNKNGDIYCGGRLITLNNIGLNSEWQGIMCSTSDSRRRGYQGLNSQLSGIWLNSAVLPFEESLILTLKQEISIRK